MLCNGLVGLPFFLAHPSQLSSFSFVYSRLSQGGIKLSSFSFVYSRLSQGGIMETVFLLSGNDQKVHLFREVCL